MKCRIGFGKQKHWIMYLFNNTTNSNSIMVLDQAQDISIKCLLFLSFVENHLNLKKRYNIEQKNATPPHFRNHKCNSITFFTNLYYDTSVCISIWWMCHQLTIPFFIDDITDNFMKKQCLYFFHFWLNAFNQKSQ